MKKVIYFLGIFYIIIGSVFITNTFPKITGLSITEEITPAQNSFTGIFFILAGFILVSMSKRERKAQAAMEFLMTYGWAILGVIIVISVLVSSGIFTRIGTGDPRVLLSPPFAVKGASIGDGGDAVALDIQNNGGDTKTIEEISIEACGTSDITIPVQSGATQNFVIVCNEIITTIVNSEIIVVYTNPGSSLEQTATGSISGSAEPDTTPPIQSGWNPPSGTDVTGTFTLTFNLHEPGDCEYTDLDVGYGYDPFATPCSGAGTASISCSVTAGAGALDIHTNCRDTFNNADTETTNTALNYV